jgi:ribokinase
VRCAVVGHVEWVEFARVPWMPSPGEIVHAERVWEEPAGGGAVVARQVALVAGRCELFTALGVDALGRDSATRLAGLGIDVHG